VTSRRRNVEEELYAIRNVEKKENQVIVCLGPAKPGEESYRRSRDRGGSSSGSSPRALIGMKTLRPSSEALKG
jgi:hypothetical protein